MDVLRVQDAMQQCWQEQWPALAQVLEQSVSAGSALQVMQSLLQLLRKICLAGFRAWLMNGDPGEPHVVRAGQQYRFKVTEAKEFLTLCGPLTIERRLYQQDRGGPIVAPLDEAWGMVGEFATPEVREAGTYLMGLAPAAEVTQILQKTALFSPGATSLKKFASQFGVWQEDHLEALTAIRSTEETPADTQVVAASLDGTNVRLSEPGPKPGRRAAGADGDAAPSCFKNAMVGTVTYYGAVPAHSNTPKQLQTKYVGRMPEEGSPTFRREFEAEVAATLARSAGSVAKVLVLDAATALWHYVASRPLFADFAKIVDFYHAAEHLNSAAEALFGKGTSAAKAWWDKHRGTLLEHDDGAARVIRAIDYAVQKRRLPKWAKNVVATQRQFFVNHGSYMTYASFRARGWPIGSGPVEAAGKMLVKQRLGRSGMRWSRAGGQHILNIRTLIKSNRWDAVWKRHLQLTLAA